jgi:hypothetical protein
MAVSDLELIKMYEKGQQLLSADVNALIENARRQIIGSDAIGDSNAVSIGGRPYIRPTRRNSGMPIKNTSGVAMTPGAVTLPKTAAAITADEMGWEVGKPDVNGWKLMIVADLSSADIANNGYSDGCWAWQGAWCRYTGSAPAYGERWGTSSGSWDLTKPGCGTFIALGNTITIGTTTYGRFVQLLQPKMFCVTTSSLSHGSTCTAKRIKWTGSAWQKTTEEFTVYDIFLNTADTVASGTVIGVIPYEGLLVVDSMYCAANDWSL